MLMKDCKPTYKGIRYDNVNQIIDVIKQENFGNPFDSRGESFSPRQIKESVSEVFEMKPELSNIGSQQQYSRHLDTIFPGSQSKNILYHGGNQGIKEFTKDKLGETTKAESAKYGFFFSSNKNVSNTYINNFITEYTGEFKEIYDNYEKRYDEIEKARNDLWKKEKEIKQNRNNLIFNLKEFFKQLFDKGYISSRKQLDDIYKELNTLFDKKEAIQREAPPRLEKFIADTGKNILDNIKIVQERKEGKDLYPVVLDIKNPLIKDYKEKEKNQRFYSDNVKEAAESNQYDSAILKNVIDPYELWHTIYDRETGKRFASEKGNTIEQEYTGDDYIVFESEQIHILGGEKDLQKFKDFVDRDIALSPRQENKPEKYQLFPGVYANKQQEEAIDNLRLFLSDDKQNSISLVGRGGTGKTTIIKKIVEDSNRTPYFIAPTHKAKSVLSQSTGAPANTLASALMIDLDLNTGKFKPNLFKRKMRLRQGLGETPISDYSLIIIDEGSMMNDEMFNEVMKLKDPSAKVIMMGDNVQLPPVGQESDSKMFDLDKSKLTERMRQGEESPIVPLTDIIAENVESEKPEIRVIKDRENKFDKDSNQGVLFLKSEEAALKEFGKDYKNNPKSTKIITFNNQNNDSEQSVKNLNKKIRAKLQPDALNHLVEGDQVMAYSSTMLDGSAMSEDNDVQNSSEYTVQSPGPIEERGVMILAKSKKLGVRSERLVFEGQKVDLVDNITGELLDRSHVIPTERGKKQIADFKNKHADKKDFQMLYKVDEKIPQMEFGYAINSHKAQGSTYRNVYVAEDNILSGSLRSAKVKNQSLYVAISRASDKVVIQSMKNPSDKIESTMELGDKIQDTPLSVGQTQKKPDLTPDKKYENWLYGKIESDNPNMEAKREWIIDEVLDKDSELNQRIAKGQPIKGKGSHMPVLKQFIQDNSPLFTDRPKINDSMSIRQNIAQEGINNIEFNC